MYKSSNKRALQSLLIKLAFLMKLITLFKILNRKFKGMYFIKEAIKSRKLATERLHYDYRKMFKNKKYPIIVNGYV